MILSPMKIDISRAYFVRLVHRFFRAGAYCLTTLNGFNGLLSDYKSEKRNAVFWSRGENPVTEVT